MEKKEEIESSSSFVGFFDGYKASNIALVEHRIKYHISQILDLLNYLLKLEKNDNNLNEFLNKSMKLIDSPEEIIPKMQTFGDTLNAYLAFYKFRSEDKEKEVIQKFEEIIYHFLKLAQKSADSYLLALAVKIAEYSIFPKKK